MLKPATSRQPSSDKKRSISDRELLIHLIELQKNAQLKLYFERSVDSLEFSPIPADEVEEPERKGAERRSAGESPSGDRVTGPVFLDPENTPGDVLEMFEEDGLSLQHAKIMLVWMQESEKISAIVMIMLEFKNELRRLLRLVDEDKEILHMPGLLSGDNIRALIHYLEDSQDENIPLIVEKSTADEMEFSRLGSSVLAQILYEVRGEFLGQDDQERFARWRDKINGIFEIEEWSRRIDDASLAIHDPRRQDQDNFESFIAAEILSIVRENPEQESFAIPVDSVLAGELSSKGSKISQILRQENLIVVFDRPEEGGMIIRITRNQEV